ncbi:MAG: 30S ribosomal protein S20 [Candidatus Riflebacteria bacterium]|nr:30S ribosomal protein S20 [Candidatus Riflebacteria bacterium]
MPVVHKDAEKRARQTRKRALRNQSIQTRLKTESKKLLTAVSAKDSDTALTLYRAVSRLYDQAAAKGVIHQNAASRKKSRLRLKVNGIGKQQAVATSESTKRTAKSKPE